MAAGCRATGWFEAVGLELEYMIVGRDSLDVLPICDGLLAAHNGGAYDDACFEDVTWSNELALHVVELKTSAPAPSVVAAADRFHTHVRTINDFLHPRSARLASTAMHPWMDPSRQFRIWPHSNAEVYAAFDRIFDCRGHGWANLQSMHINLPFKGDEEFARLHAAIRLVLPILPALAASSPFMDGRVTGKLDTRLDVYRTNCARIPNCTGLVIPESVSSMDEYQARILGSIYSEMTAHDPQGVLRYEWINARGAIARFDRNTIEIRVIDMQECPSMDMAVAALVVEVVRMVAEERLGRRGEQDIATPRLKDVFDSCVCHAEAAVLGDTDYLRALGWASASPCTAQELWQHLTTAALRYATDRLTPFEPQLQTILQQGTLARRLIRARNESDPQGLRSLMDKLCDCLEENRPLISAAEPALVIA